MITRFQMITIDDTKRPPNGNVRKTNLRRAFSTADEGVLLG